MAKKPEPVRRMRARVEEEERSSSPAPKKFYARARAVDSRRRSGLVFSKAWAEYSRGGLSAEQFEAIQDDPFVEVSESKPRNFGEV